MYACARFGLCFMSRTNKAVATTTTTKSCNQHLLYYHSTILFSPFLAHIRLSWLQGPWWYKWCDLNFQGGIRPGVYQNRSHHHQEEDEMARACMLAFLLSGWQENGQMITISLSTHHHKAWRISKTLYHSSWPYGLSSLLTDCIKSKHLD